MALFGWSKGQPPDDILDAKAGPEALLLALDKAVPIYIGKTDRGELIYPACKRGAGDPQGSAREIWRHTRLEALRYLAMIPGRDNALLADPTRQSEMMASFLRHTPHDLTFVDFTGRPLDDIAIAVFAGLNWLSHCAVLAKVDRSRASGSLRNFRKVVIVAQRWWEMEGANARCEAMLAAHELPPLMLNLVWLEYTHLAKEIVLAAAFGTGPAQGSETYVDPDAVARVQEADDPEELEG